MAGKKITPNVRRILGYSRTFAHYLADEEALLAQSGGPSTPVATPIGVRPGILKNNASRAATPTGRSAGRGQQLPMHPPPRAPGPRTASTPITTASNLKPELSLETLRPSETPSTVAHEPHSDVETRHSPSSMAAGVATLLPVNPKLDNDPLLKSNTPKFPPPQVMEALLSEPPLSYNTARAKPLENGKPMRHFCSVCGYWGKVKCRQCGDRTCGLMECWKAHEAGCAHY